MNNKSKSPTTNKKRTGNYYRKVSPNQQSKAYIKLKERDYE